MYVNIDRLPAGQDLFTVCVTDDPRDTDPSEIFYEEVDVVAPYHATATQVVAAMDPEDREDYEECWVFAILNQSSGGVMFDSRDNSETLQVSE